MTVRGALIPQMLLLHVVMDNNLCTMLIKSLTFFNNMTFFLPGYSPDLNLIEELFSFVKYYLEKHDELLQVISDPTPVSPSAFSSITSEHSLIVFIMNQAQWLLPLNQFQINKLIWNGFQ